MIPIDYQFKGDTIATGSTEHVPQRGDWVELPAGKFEVSRVVWKREGQEARVVVLLIGRTFA